MNYSIVFAFCIVQIIVLLGVLTQKRIRNVINFLLASIQIIILLKFVYYYFHFKGLFLDYPYLVYIIRLLQSLAAPFLLLYASAIITGSTFLRKYMFLYAVPSIVALVFFTPLVIETIHPELISNDLAAYNRWFGLIAAELAGLLFIIYSQFIFRKFFRMLRKITTACLIWKAQWFI